jgi:uncharacterized protein YbaP (TraB family)
MTTTVRLYFLFVFIFFNIIFLNAQTRDNYDLLWEIQHKDSNKKSYLFGTLHVKDSRAFKFSDSVIPAIKKSEMFALEIHPDSVYDNFDDNYYSSGLENVFKKILSKEDYARLKSRFYELNNTDLDSFPLMHPQLIESMLTKEKDKPDDKQTFLDAYLYGIAYNNKRQIAGLENIEDQIPTIDKIDEDDIKESILYLLDSSIEEQDEQLERIIELYYNGNIDEILYYVNLNEPADEIMVKRNNVMANSIEDIMKDHTVFAAVGTAHLPGKNGVIDLLRKKGYTVKKVNATFTQSEEPYQIIPDTDHWYEDNNKELGYSVLTPNKAISMNLGGKFETQTSTDLIFGGTFAYMAMDLRSETLKKDFDFVENIIKGQMASETDSLISKRTFQKDSIQFTEVLIRKKENISRMQLAFANKIVYFFFTENTMDEVKSPYADAFFNSIKVFSPKYTPSVWHTKIDSIGAYSVRFPDVEKDLSHEKENPNGEERSPYDLKIFTSSDKAEHTLYLFRYNDQPLGYYINQKAAYYDYFENYFKERGILISEPKSITMDGIEGKAYEIMFADKYHTVAKLFLRGNRTYLLMAQKTVENEKVTANDEFLNSFKFLPYAEAPFDSIVNISEKYSFKTPNKKVILDEEPYEAESEYSYVKNYSALDLQTAGTYLVQEIKLKPYYRQKSLEVFYEEYVDALKDYNDTLISNIPTTVAGKPAREILMENPNTHVKQRMKLLLDDNTIFLFLTYLGDEEINEPRVDEFFNSFEIKNNTSKFNLSASKADLIFKNLKSKDSVKFKEAKGALGYYTFDASEYKILEKNLKNRYRDDSIYYGAKYYIISNLVTLRNTETLKTLTNYYKNKKTSNNARLAILERILDFENEEASATYFDLLENHQPERVSGTPFNVLYSLSDTIPLFVANDERFARLADTKDYRDKIAAFYKNNVLKDSVYGGKMPLLKNTLLKNMYADAKAYIDTIARKNSSFINYNLIYNYIDIAKTVKESNSDINKTLKFLVDELEEDQWLRTQALMACVELDIEIDQKTLNDAFEDMYSRFEMMESMVEVEKTELIPEEYLEPIEFAKLSLYNTAGGEYEEYPNIFEYLGETTIDDKNYYAFTFSYTEDDGEKYFGIAEETAINFSDFKMANAYVDWEVFEEDWQTQAANLIKETTTIDNEVID